MSSHKEFRLYLGLPEDQQIACGARVLAAGRHWYRKLLVISELVRQQKILYLSDTRSVQDRIVSLTQPHIRPLRALWPLFRLWIPGSRGSQRLQEKGLAVFQGDRRSEQLVARDLQPR